MKNNKNIEKQRRKPIKKHYKTIKNELWHLKTIWNKKELRKE